MDQIERLVLLNERFAASEGAPAGELPAPPARELAIVTCMDARLDVYAALGLARGEAHVLRNAGGVITEDVIRSLAISQRRLGTREVMLIHHTRCGMEGLDEDELREELTRAAGAPPPFRPGGFADVEANVCESLRRVRASPLLAHRDHVRGFVYDLDTGLLREVRG